MKKFSAILIFFWLMAVCAFPVVSQQPTATLTGVVTDPSGAVIQGATVTTTNKATNLSRAVSTNSEGVYVIANLPVGEYEVKVSYQNFVDRVFGSVALNVGQTL